MSTRGREAGWIDLYRADPTATPFQSPAWVESWCRAYAPADVRTVATRGGPGEGEVARTVLVAERHRGVRVLRPAGGNLADFTDVLLDRSVPGAPRALVDALLASDDWDVVDFPEVPPNGGVSRLLASWPGRFLVSDSSVCPELVTARFTDFLAGLPRARRHDIRRRVRCLQRAGIEDHRVTEPSEVAAAAERLLALHYLQWAGRPMNPQHESTAFRRHFVASARDLSAHGEAIIVEYRQAGEVVASTLYFVGREVLGGYLYGYHPRLRAGLDLNTLFVQGALDLAYELGLPRFSQLRGIESAKLKWYPTLQQNQRILLVHPHSARGNVFAAATAVRRRTGRMVRRAGLV
jgi:CelD/BcsL family acetyltransferase involved in cellulose biosynthesis